MQARRFRERSLGGEAGGVALDVVAGEAAEQLVDGDAEGFALDVPQGQVDGAEGVDFLAAGG
jgi:hypothetical protein